MIEYVFYNYKLDKIITVLIDADYESEYVSFYIKNFKYILVGKI